MCDVFIFSWIGFFLEMNEEQNRQAVRWVCIFPQKNYARLNFYVMKNANPWFDDSPFAEFDSRRGTSEANANNLKQLGIGNANGFPKALR